MPANLKPNIWRIMVICAPLLFTLEFDVPDSSKYKITSSLADAVSLALLISVGSPAFFLTVTGTLRLKPVTLQLNQ